MKKITQVYRDKLVEMVERKNKNYLRDRKKHIDNLLYELYNFIRKDEGGYMKNKYIDLSKKLKVLSDPKRLEIIDMLSCNELCACEILEKFDITQPTLSNDMKRLEEANLVISRREGKNIYYIANKKILNEMQSNLKEIFDSGEDCICHTRI